MMPSRIPFCFNFDRVSVAPGSHWVVTDDTRVSPRSKNTTLTDAMVPPSFGVKKLFPGLAGRLGRRIDGVAACFHCLTDIGRMPEQISGMPDEERPPRRIGVVHALEEVHHAGKESWNVGIF